MTLLFLVLTGLSTVKALHNLEKTQVALEVEFQWIARWIESEQHRHVAQARQAAFLVINQIRKGLGKRICRQGVTGAPGLDPEFGRFALADPNGKISCNSIPWLVASNVSGKRYFIDALKQSDLGVINVGEISQASDYEAIMARPMRDDGHVQYVILVAMDFSWVKEETKEVKLPPEGHLLLVNGNGIVIAGSSNVSKWVNKTIANTAFYQQAKSASGPVLDGLDLTGQRSMIVMRQFKTGSGDMSVILDVPLDTLLWPAYRSLANALLISLLEFVVVLVLVYYWGERYFLRKILAIEQAASQLAGGDWTARVKMAPDGELGRLAKSFDLMADSLQVQDAQIRAVNDELSRVNRALRVLSAGNRSLLFAKTEPELLERICRDIVEEGGYLAAWIGFAGPEHDMFLRTAASYSTAEDKSDRIDWNKAGNGLQPVLTAVREDKALIINDTSQESVHKRLGEQAAKFGYRSVIILPLHMDGKPFGALILCAQREDEFGAVQVQYLKETASDTSFGIEMLRTKGERNRLALLGEHHELMLRNSLEDALRAISMTIEMRDPYTAGHQRRVAELAKAIAMELGMSDDETHGIYLAAIVHDIGKINVPAEILVKPSALNDLEYGLVKNHVLASYEILKGIKFPWPLAEMVRQHHERLDGTGYPFGIGDGDILFGARILAVADVVEAMASHRPYRAGLGIEVALNEVEKGKFTLFDHVVVDACQKLFREGTFRFV
ncbi:MAG: HD domain-containing protein [Gallionellaceae bacterium]|nr:HD domain-containing protein [Gallionellaceae bacterium]